MTASVGGGVILGTERTTKGESMSEYKPKAGDFVQVVNRGDGWVADTGDRLRWEDLEDPVLVREGVDG